MNVSLIAATLFIVVLASSVSAEGFVPPKPYPISRYETGWQKNPFTLKTAAVAIQKVNFANDLTLAGVRQSGEDTTVILANKITREYTRLKNAEPSSTGIKVKAAHLMGKRGESYVELESGNETAIVRYDESFLLQMAAQSSMPQPPALMNAANANAAGVALAPGAPLPPGVTPPNILPKSLQNPTTSRVGLPPLPGVPNAQTNVPTPIRRRLQTAPKSESQP